MDTPDPPGEPFEFHLTGSLDLPAARRLCDALIGAGRVRLVVDVSRARELHDDALALLSGALKLLGPRVSLRGLNRHHAKLLRYLGAPLREPASSANAG
jgi:hypothetical protein